MGETRASEAVTCAPLSAAHATLLDAVADRLVPRDEHGPGALDAGATRYIRQALEAELALHAPAYRTGLDALDAASRARHDGRGFGALDAAAQDALLAAFEEDEPAFFALLWQHLLEGLLGDPAWGGNEGGAGWALIGYGGPQAVWSAADQRIVVEGEADRRVLSQAAPDRRVAAEGV